MDLVTAEVLQISKVRCKPAETIVVMSRHEPWRILGGVCCYYFDMQTPPSDSAPHLHPGQMPFQYKRMNATNAPHQQTFMHVQADLVATDASVTADCSWETCAACLFMLFRHLGSWPRAAGWTAMSSQTLLLRQAVACCNWRSATCM